MNMRFDSQLKLLGRKEIVDLKGLEDPNFI